MHRFPKAPRRWIASTALASLTLLAACGSDQPAGPTESPSRDAQGSTVTQRTFKFLPPSLHVTVGTSVTWVNEDTVDHTVTSGTPGSPTGAFDEPLGKEATVVIPFEEPGMFAYFCSIHPSMTGEIVAG